MNLEDRAAKSRHGKKTWYILYLDECAISKPYSIQFMLKHQFNPEATGGGPNGP